MGVPLPTSEKGGTALPVKWGYFRVPVKMGITALPVKIEVTPYE